MVGAVVLYITLAVGIVVSILFTVETTDHVLPKLSMNSKTNEPVLVNVYHVAQELFVTITHVLLNMIETMTS
ncbi:TPA: hypothetical protein DCZ39_06905 [Patescibacteria group bacterium]|nr:hypothetical protein [Candidatus Gracilibacteria bacterium]